MKILALDIATNTGIAVGSSNGKPKCWSVDLGYKVPEKKYRPNHVEESDYKYWADCERFSQALIMASGLIATHKPDLVVIEAFIGGENASAYLIGLVACVRGVAHNNGIKSVMVYPATVRKHFLGKALTSADFPGMKQAKAKIAIKERVSAQCRAFGWSVPDLDAADAAATWDWACATKAPRYQAKPSGGLF